mmetsp:Transcript_35346/g.111701  ORF Transcript_35346/g.111701 Transcript_35346/m.111701 type:complete len:280 (-) Transcript_35346:1-840(-)
MCLQLAHPRAQMGVPSRRLGPHALQLRLERRDPVHSLPPARDLVRCGGGLGARHVEVPGLLLEAAVLFLQLPLPLACERLRLGERGLLRGHPRLEGPRRLFVLALPALLEGRPMLQPVEPGLQLDDLHLYRAPQHILVLLVNLNLHLPLHKLLGLAREVLVLPPALPDALPQLAVGCLGIGQSGLCLPQLGAHLGARAHMLADDLLALEKNPLELRLLRGELRAAPRLGRLGGALGPDELPELLLDPLGVGLSPPGLLPGGGAQPSDYDQLQGGEDGGA